MSQNGHTDQRWHQLLLDAYRDAGSPTMRALGRQTGLSAVTVHNAISGKSRPSREKFVSLVAALVTDPAVAAATVQAYDTPPPGSRIRARNAPPAITLDADAVEALTAAIRQAGADIAGAIRELTDIWKQEQ